MPVIERPTDEEAYLWAIISDPSGVDLCEFAWHDGSTNDGCWRAWPFQWKWFRDMSPLQIDQSARSIGKSLGIKIRAFAFPFLHPNQEMVITAPEGVHLDAITDLVETSFMHSRLGRQMITKGRTGIKHRPFHVSFANGARIMGRIPQKDGKGIKGCVEPSALVFTQRGLVRADEILVGDKVWSHENRWSSVEDVYPVTQESYRMEGQGSFPVIVSDKHRVFGRYNQNTAKQKRDLSGLDWEWVDHLADTSRQFYWASVAEFPAEQAVPVVVPECDIDAALPEFWWLVGRWLADGYVTDQPLKGGGRGRARVHFVVHPSGQPALFARMDALGLRKTIKTRVHSSADIVEFSSTAMARWLKEQFGNLANGKRLPPFLYFMEERFRRALLEGYWAGDGTYVTEKSRFASGSASKSLSLGLGLLAHTLGYSVGYGHQKIKVTEIMGVPLKAVAQDSWRVRMCSSARNAHFEGGYVSYKLRKVVPVGETDLVNIVSTDHSYLADGIFHHNTHPLMLELDEGQDYPSPGWVEITETLKRGHVGATWRVHGVTRGVRDYFYKFTQPHSGWKVHRITAMHRPTWSDQERKEKIENYGSRDHPDYRRNVLGAHGDASNPLFVLATLMQCVDTDEASDYNQKEYFNLRINNEMVQDLGGEVFSFLNFPQTHHDLSKIFWIGMDVGYTNHPSEILVFAEVSLKAGQPTTMKLVTRVHLERMPHGCQVDTILKMIDFYQPKAFAMDKTGLGLPLFQDIQERAPHHAPVIKGYNFSSKILVDIDKTIELDEFRGDEIKDAGIERNVLEYSSDKLREFVDDKRLTLPWDKELLGEFQGQTYQVVRDNINMYGRREFNKGKFHALDAARMAILGKVQTPIEAMVEARTEQFVPSMDIFLDAW